MPAPVNLRPADMAGRDIKVALQVWDEAARSALNEPVGAWADVCDIWASRKDKEDRESEVAGAQGSAAVTQFRVRSNSITRAITPGRHRIWDGARAWNIKGIMLDNHRGRGDVVTITAVADSTGGNA